MLKIKDSIRLQYLKKYGFNYYDNEQSSYYGCADYYNDDISIFVNNAKTIIIKEHSGRSCLDYDVLYDLIQAGLVEKVEE